MNHQLIAHKLLLFYTYTLGTEPVIRKKNWNWAKHYWCILFVLLNYLTNIWPWIKWLNY